MPGKREQEELARLHGQPVGRTPKRLENLRANAYARKHGVFAAYFIDDEEQESFARLRERFSQDYPSETAADETALDLVCFYLLRLGRAIKAGEVDYIVKLDGTVRNHLRDLKATRITREGDKPTGPETTPAEWASNLLASGKTGSGKACAKVSRKNAEKMADNSKTADPVTSENAGDSDGSEAQNDH